MEIHWPSEHILCQTLDRKVAFLAEFLSFMTKN
jgi:hypothetical protein